MKIKDVEERVEIPRASIRYYEREGLLVTGRNPANGYREYSEENVECLERIIFLRKLGISIEDIRCFQKGDVALSEILESRKKQIVGEKEDLQRQTELSEILLKEKEMEFSSLKISLYGQTAGDRIGPEILGNPVSAFTALKEAGLIWGIIIISFLLAVLSLLFLPEKIPVDFVDDLVRYEAGKWVMFLFPLAGILGAVFLKTMVLNWLHQQAPMMMSYGEEIADYLGIWFVSSLCGYQLLIIIFTGGYYINIELVWEVLNIVFLVIGAFLLFLRYRRGKAGRYTWKH